MRTTSRALRTSILAATAITAIGFGAHTATSAFADTAENTAAAGNAAATSTATTAVTVAADGETQVFTAAAGTVDAKTVASTAPAKRVLVKTVKLAAKGHTAKVYKLGKACFQADILFHGKKVATVNAFGKDANANLNGLHVKLTKTGKISSWADRAKPQPKPKPKPKPQPEKREHVRNDTLADGSMARIYKFSANHWQAVISSGPGAAAIGTLDANGRSAAGENNGLHVVLSPDGKLTSWLDDAGTPAPAPEPTPEPEPTPDPFVPDNEKPQPQPLPEDKETAPKPEGTDTAAKPETESAVPTPIAPSTDPAQVQLTPAA